MSYAQFDRYGPDSLRFVHNLRDELGWAEAAQHGRSANPAVASSKIVELKPLQVTTS
jgi:hypothetical protein